jgi:predicted phosphodiesterase
MISNQLAVISDIHGNRWALEAVLQDIRERGIEAIANLGDSLYGPLDPAGTADILRQFDIPTVRGNEDRIIVEPSRESPTLSFVLQSLATDQREWLESLPLTMALDDGILLFHGTPFDDAEYLLWKVGESGAVLREGDEVLAELQGTDQRLFLCGHDHLQRKMLLPDGKLVVDPGSVGLPAYADDHSHPHAMESGSPHARYAIIGRSAEDWVVEQVVIPYDWRAAADRARSNGREDWAEWLMSGET